MATSKPGDARLIPVHAQDGCRGHLLRSRHQWAAFDADDRLLGMYDTINAGTAALLELAITTEETND